MVRSQDYLRSATLPPLDLVLIAGAHAFPIPLAAVRLVRLGPVRRLFRLAWSACTDPARSLGLLRRHFRRRSP